MSPSEQRKADAYRKIQLGGLVIKGGLGEFEPAVVLGAVIDAAQRLASPDERDRLKRLGDAGFNNGRRE
jgi:Conjugal transfer protein TraD